MTTLTETLHAASFLASEASGTRSRDSVTILSGQNLLAGTVLGKVAHGTASAAAFAGNTGTGTVGAITLSAGAKVGAHKLVIIEPAGNAGTFTVEDPDGITIGTGNVAVAFSGGGLAFTLSDGTDFIAGDGFTITVAAGSGKYKKYDPANTDGSETAIAVLYADCDASSADKTAVPIISRDAEVISADLVWFSGANAGQKTTGKAQLALQGIIAR
jgi:hypothetical protein